MTCKSSSNGATLPAIEWVEAIPVPDVVIESAELWPLWDAAKAWGDMDDTADFAVSNAVFLSALSAAKPVRPAPLLHTEAVFPSTAARLVQILTAVA